MPKASVVILARNSEAWLIDALESVSAQTCPRDWVETIIVDQGSTDATSALARFFLARHDMRGGLHAADPASRRRDWIQFIKSGTSGAQQNRGAAGLRGATIPIHPRGFFQMAVPLEERQGLACGRPREPSCHPCSAPIELSLRNRHRWVPRSSENRR
jgi:glycosyltransferase involved in cell wall biosynthesis